MSNGFTNSEINEIKTKGIHKEIWDQITKLAECGCTNSEIAIHFHKKEEDLQGYIIDGLNVLDEIEWARNEGKIGLRRQRYLNAMMQNVNMQKYLSGVLLGEVEGGSDIEIPDIVYAPPVQSSDGD